MYSSQNDFKKSNFYLNLSKYLNPKFYFNITLEVDNYYKNHMFIDAKNLLKEISEKNIIYSWYKIKQNTKIISKLESDEQAIKYIKNKFSEIERSIK